MVLKKLVKLSKVACIAFFIPMLVGCNGSNDTTTLRLAHNLGTDHPAHHSLAEFSQLAYENSNGEMEVEIFPNGMLGGERNVIEMVQAGVLEFARVSATALEAFNESYQIFSLPYVFQSQEHFHNVMDNSLVVQEIFDSTKDQRFIAISWYDAGQRSIYLNQDKKVESPEDLSGMKIRVQESPTTIALIREMGGTATPMPFGEVYTGLQQGIIDGAESNETALTLSGHGEVTRSYTYTEHQFSPDILIVSTRFWDELTVEEQEIFISAAHESSQNHKERWDNSIKQAVEQAEQMGVTFYDIDKTEFINSTAPLREQFTAQSEDNRRIFQDFESFLEINAE